MVSLFATGTLLFSIPPVRDFLAYAMNAGSATGVAREPQLVWAVALGAVSYGALIYPCDWVPGGFFEDGIRNQGWGGRRLPPLEVSPI